MDDLRARGRAHAGGPARYAELLAARRRDDVAAVAFTSGTTGPPRGALHSHESQLAMARLVAAHLGLRPRDRSFSLLPLAHVAARLFDVHAPLVAGSYRALRRGARHDAVGPRRDRADRAARHAAPARAGQGRRRPADRARRLVQAERLPCGAARHDPLDACPARRASRTGHRSGGRARARRPLRRRARRASETSATAGITGSFVAPELLTWFWALGLPMREQYGQVETGGVVSTQRGLADAGTAGGPLDPADRGRGLGR